MGIFVSLQDHGHEPCIEQGFKSPQCLQLLIHSEHRESSRATCHLCCSEGEKTVIMDMYTDKTDYCIKGSTTKAITFP